MLFCSIQPAFLRKMPKLVKSEHKEGTITSFLDVSFTKIYHDEKN